MNKIYETEKIKQITQRKIEQINRKHQNPELENDLEELKTAINQELQTQETIIYIHPNLRQMFLWRLAGSLIAHDERRLYYKHEAITLITENKDIQKILQRIYKEQYPEIKKQIYTYQTILSEINYHLDQATQHPTGSEEHKKHEKEALKEIRKLPATNTLINQLYHIICTHTNLGQYTIPNTAINEHTKQIKKPQYQENEHKKNKTENNIPPEET